MQYFVNPIEFSDIPLIIISPLFLKLIAINIPFDLATVWVSLKMLQIVSERKPLMGIIAIGMDLIIAIGLAVLCASMAIALLAGEPNPLSLGFDRVIRAVAVLFGTIPVEYGDDWEFTSGFLGTTTLIPTMAYLLVLLLLYLAKPIFDVGRSAAMYLFERASEDEPVKMILFTLIGSIGAAIVLICKTAQHFIGSM